MLTTILTGIAIYLLIGLVISIVYHLFAKGETTLFAPVTFLFLIFTYPWIVFNFIATIVMKIAGKL